jgi:hypothetical protein
MLSQFLANKEKKKKMVYPATRVIQKAQQQHSNDCVRW